MAVSILGCGWFGRALAVALLAEGKAVKGSASDAERLGELSALGIDPYLISLPNFTQQPAFFDTDVLVISIPPKFRKGEGDTFIPKIQRAISAIKQFEVKHIIYTSSTAVYGEGQGAVDELTKPIAGDEQGKLLLKAEELFQNEQEFQTTIIRFAGLVGPGRHPGRFFAGKKDIPNGQGAVNLVHLEDTVAITQSIIAQAKWGMVFNACSPDHPARSSFYSIATQVIGLPLPEFKNELLTNKQVNSINLKPVLNYQFKYDNWARALADASFLL